MLAPTRTALALLLTVVLLALPHAAAMEPAEETVEAIIQTEQETLALSCGFLSAFNCGSATITATADESSCYLSGNTYVCRVDVTATVAATGWLNPGGFTASISIPCPTSASRSWTIAGATADLSCSAPMYVNPLSCATQSARLEVSYTGTFAPPSQVRTTATQSVCSSLVIALYQHADFSGGRRYFTATPISDFWTFYFDNGAWMNDAVSSIRVAGGCSVRLYQHASFSGNSATFPEGNYNYVGNLMNDQASSMSVGSC